MVRPLRVRQMQPRRAELMQNCTQAPTHTEQPPHGRNRNNACGSHGRIQNIRQRRKDHGHTIRGQHTSTVDGRISHMVTTLHRKDMPTANGFHKDADIADATKQACSRGNR